MRLKKITSLLLVSLFFSSVASAEEYTVEQGDSLYKISRQFGVSIEDVRQKNKLSSDMLKIGQKLIIPGEDPESSKPVSKEAIEKPKSDNALVKRAVVNVNNLNVRLDGNINSKILSMLKKGTNVDILEEEESWTKIKSGETIGFVFSPYLSLSGGASVSRSTDMLETRVKNLIQPLIGIPYRYGGTTPDGFDCSGFTMYVMGQMGIKIPRVSENQISVGIPVDREDLQVGDLLFFDSFNSGKISHVSIYLGNNKIVHSATKKVEINDLDWYFANYPYYGARRVLGSQ